MKQRRSLGPVLLAAGMLALPTFGCSNEGSVPYGLGGLGSPGCGCDDEWTIECYCSVFECVTFEEATRPVDCENRPPGAGPGGITTGCGLISVNRGYSFSSWTQVYTEDTHELVGAWSISDDGVCPAIHEYSAGESLDDCDDVATEPFCP